MKDCANCGAALHETQDWCVQCGAAQPGSVGSRPRWLTATAVLGCTSALVVGASVAAYAALTKHHHRHPSLVALHTPAAAVTPGTVPPASTVPATPGTSTPVTPAGTLPPKVPTQTPTPQGEAAGGAGSGSGASAFFNTPAEGSKSSKSSSGKGGKSGGSGNGSASNNASKEGVNEGGGAGSSSGGSEGSKSEGGKEPPTPILLDTNAASTYNPNAYPAPSFGDPSLAIDGEGSTAWTASVDGASAPKMAEGIVLDLKTAQKLGALKVKTSTPGFTVEIYGANGHNLPAAITDPTWKRLHGSRVLKKKTVTVKLKTKGAAYRYVLLWLTKAPPSSTPTAPGRVAIDELELFSPS